MYIIMILCSNVQNKAVCLGYCQLFVLLSILENQQKITIFIVFIKKKKVF